MKQIIKNTILAASVMMSVVPAVAQTSNSAYFLEGSYTRQMLNPAFQPERAYIAFPGLSNLNIGVDLNAGLSNFLFESASNPGKLTTFMSKDVSSSRFLSGLPDDFRFHDKLDMSLLSLGFGGETWYAGINLSLRDRQSVSIPKSMFAFMKAGLANGEYVIEDLNVTSVTYAELALNYSQKVIENLTVGGTVKALLGGAYANANIDRIDALLTGDSWKVKTKATVNVAVPGGELTLNDKQSPSGFEYAFEVPSSYGIGLDLGAVYDMGDLVEGLILSASVTNLGSIKWKNVQTLATAEDEYVEFGGFDHLDVQNAGDDNTIDELGDDFADMIKLYSTAGQTEKMKLGATYRFGAEYHLPWVKCLSVGELLTSCPSAAGLFESRTSLTLTPCRWFELSGNMALSNLGTSYGGIMNLHMAGLNFFLAAELMNMKVNPQMIPMDKFHTDINLGVNIPVGKRRF